MYHKIVNKFDVECLERAMEQGNIMNGIPRELSEKVIGAIRETVGIFDEYYGGMRHPEASLGGDVILLPTIQDTELFYDEILKHYNLNEEYAESVDTVAEGDNIKFLQQTYLLSSDFGIVLVLPMEEE